MGVTDDQRLLHMNFTLREAGTLIRVISARDMHRKERTIYEQAYQSLIKAWLSEDVDQHGK